MDGLFLGSNNQTNWAVHYSQSANDGGEQQPHWSLRLRGPETKMKTIEYETLIRIDGS